MADPVKRHEEAVAAQRAAREAMEQKMADIAASVLNTKDGQQLFAYLAAKFHYRGRSFIASSQTAPFDPYGAAVRDGEKAVINHVFSLARKSDPELKLP